MHGGLPACDPEQMSPQVSVVISAEDRARLAAVVADRNRPLKHVQRARIVLLSTERLPVLEVARRADVSRSAPAVRRWRMRCAEQAWVGS
jgi:hypothetical protein